MTPDQSKSVMNDITNVHWPNTTPEQARMLVSKLHHYPEAIVVDAIKDFARMHDHLNVEKLLHGVAELAKTRNLNEHRQRREADAAERAEIEAEDERMDAALSSISEEQFADLLEEVRQEYGDRFTPRMYEKGRANKALRGLVYQRLKQSLYRRQREGATV